MRGEPGRSLYVRLHNCENGRAGKWTDAATSEHGDLLDLIALNRGLSRLRDALDEARRFLSLPLPERAVDQQRGRFARAKVPAGSPAAAARLFAASKPVHGTLAATYLQGRGIIGSRGADALRFHPRCHYRPANDDEPGTRKAWPALIAAVTDLAGNTTGVHRTFLAASSLNPQLVAKAPVACPRRALGHILGHAIRFGTADDVMIAGEGIETMLSLREIMPAMPMAAATSAAHLAAILFPDTLRRLYVARDDDPAGTMAVKTLIRRAQPIGIEVIALIPRSGDFNDDLQALGPTQLATDITGQLRPEDMSRFLS